MSTKFCGVISVNLRCIGGEVGATSSLAPKIGPLGLVSSRLIIYFQSQNLNLKISCGSHVLKTGVPKICGIETIIIIMSILLIGRFN